MIKKRYCTMVGEEEIWNAFKKIFFQFATFCTSYLESKIFLSIKKYFHSKKKLLENE